LANERTQVSKQLFFFLIYLNINLFPEIYIIPSSNMNELWHNYKKRMISNGAKEENIWGVNWTTPMKYKDNWDCLSR
jgi:hypothetical protein